MKLPEAVFVSILAFCILLLLHADLQRPMQRSLANYKLLLWMIRTCMVIIFLDILCDVADGKLGSLNHAINYYGNIVIFKIDGIPSVLWFFYFLLQIDFDLRYTTWFKWTFLSIYICSAILGLIGMQNNWFFYIDGENIFQRGRFHWAHIALCYAPMILSVVIALIKRKTIGNSLLRTLIYFILPVTIGGIIEFYYYSNGLTWAGLSISMLAVYFHIQNKGLMTDYLTGMYNRRQLDQFLLYKIRNGDRKDFSAILMDLDGFKSINDTLGHPVGDQVLRTVSLLLRESLREEDFIARFGGDEFLVVLDVDNIELLEEIVERIRARVQQFNQSAGEPYNIRFSMGYDIYRRSLRLSMIEFLEHIDALMYRQKRLAGIAEPVLPLRT